METSRRRRQIDELCAHCRAGAVGRAVDLAFEHFAAFGPDEHVVAMLEEAVATAPVGVRRRYAELRASYG